MRTSIKLTLFFDGVFWVGVFERTYKGKYEASRFVFGSEPKDYEVYNFILKNFYNIKFTISIPDEEIKEKKINPKRMQREIRKQIENREIGTKAQIAIKLQHEENKTKIKKAKREKKEEEKERRFLLKMEKRKLKHKGH
ncbi:YjdF family protein [Clostridium lundense]|uniref:YjdF family protein n=1 Tax=Clostridium lundense TaxID=319475 RepID=UPI000484A6F4|nr:YjdF family protein [Clostridium lundense]